MRWGASRKPESGRISEQDIKKQYCFYFYFLFSNTTPSISHSHQAFFDSPSLVISSSSVVQSSSPFCRHSQGWSQMSSPHISFITSPIVSVIMLESLSFLLVNPDASKYWRLFFSCRKFSIGVFEGGCIWWDRTLCCVWRKCIHTCGLSEAMARLKYEDTIDILAANISYYDSVSSPKSSLTSKRCDAKIGFYFRINDLCNLLRRSQTSVHYSLSYT